MVKNPKWQEADRLFIYKRERGVELGASKKQLQQAVRAGQPGLESGTSGLQVWHSNCSTMLPTMKMDWLLKFETFELFDQIALVGKRKMKHLLEIAW